MNHAQQVYDQATATLAEFLFARVVAYGRPPDHFNALYRPVSDVGIQEEKNPRHALPSLESIMFADVPDTRQGEFRIPPSEYAFSEQEYLELD